MDCGEITPMEKFAGTTKDISLKTHHTWGCPFYVLNAIFQGNIYGLNNWETLSRAGIYPGNSPFHAG